MKIVQVMLARGFGGAERSFLDITLDLVSRGHEVLTIVDVRGFLYPKLKENNMFRTVGVTCLGSWDWRIVKVISKETEKFGGVIIHAHLARAALLAGKASKKDRIPLLVKTHNLVNLKYYKNVNCFVPTTKAQEAYLIAGGIPSTNICKIPNFSSIAIASVQRKRSQPAVFKIKALGRFVHKKGFDLLLEAINLVRKSGQTVTLDLGGGGPEQKQLVKLIDRLGLTEVVNLVGWVDDVSQFLKDGDLFILPSRDEPFGIVVLEAMASGIPILSSKTQGPLEILDSDMGYFTNLHTSTSLADDILDTIRSEERHLKAAKALECFKQNYSASSVVAEYESLYERLLQK
jgi:glycosyltransferase involved in cell wall biosynthesis|tara:strand:+ start:1035 stop:2072 length:1038 start_codon:yes stop_codon:yes gene_type:complete